MYCGGQLSFPSEEIRLSVGSFCYSLIITNSYLVDFLTKYYNGFTSSQHNPDVVVSLYLNNEQNQNRSHYLALGEPYFSYENGMLRAYLHKEERWFEAIIERSILEGMNIRLLDKFLCQIYYTLLGTSRLSFIVHAAGIVHKDKGYVFSGPSGSGKTTVASLSYEDDAILNDEIIILEKNDNQFWVRSTPFAGPHLKKQEGSSLLKGIFLLKHAKENSLVPLRKIDFVRMLFKEIARPKPGSIPNNEIDHLKAIDFCEQIFDSVPVYQLCFRPDRSIWKLIYEGT